MGIKKGNTGPRNGRKPAKGFKTPRPPKRGGTWDERGPKEI